MAQRGASPQTFDGQAVLELCPGPARASRASRRAAARRFGPCTTPLRVLARRVGARVVASPTWLREVEASRALAGLRGDRRKTMLRVAKALALAARADSTSAPTWPVIAQEAKVSRATVGRHLAWLHSVALLVTAEHGSTQRYRGRVRFRRGAKARGRWRALVERAQPVVEGNRAAVYLLVIPLPEVVEHGLDPGPVRGVEQHETPRLPSRSEGRSNSPTRARARPPGQIAAGTAGKTRIWEGKEGGYERSEDRGTRGQQRISDLEIAAALRGRALDLRRASVAAIRSVIRPFTAAGWSAEDLAYAIDHEVGGAARIFTSGPVSTVPLGVREADVVRPQTSVDVEEVGKVRAPVAHPAGWLRSRLAAWAPRAELGGAGPVTEHRQRCQRASAATQAANAAARAQHAADRAATVAPSAGFAAARAVLAARPRPVVRLGNWMPSG